MKVIRTANRQKVLFITHKEYSAWTGKIFWSFRHKLVSFPAYIFLKIRGWLFYKLFLYLKDHKNFLIIVHWGFVIPELEDDKNVHLNIGDHDTLQNVSDFRRLYITSKDFTPATTVPDSWDILTVSHNSKRKNLNSLVAAIAEIKKKKPDLKALILVNTPSKQFRKNTVRTEVKFLDTYFSEFCYEQRCDIVLLRISDEMGLEGVSPLFVQWVMSHSKNFVLFSTSEGSAKVAAEAHLVGCQIWLREDLQGGTAFGLDGSKISYFDSQHDFQEKMLKQLGWEEGAPGLDLEALKYVNVHAVRILEAKLKKEGLLSEDDQFDEQDFAFANRWLPAHHPDDIRKFSNSVTADMDTTLRMFAVARMLNSLD